MMESTPNFTPRAQEALKNSRTIALDYRASIIDIDHLLLGLISQGRGLLREIFDLSGYDIDGFKEVVEDNIGKGKSKKENISFSKDFKAILQLAFESAASLQQSYVGTEHLLVAIIKYNSPKTQSFFKEGGINQQSLSIAIKSYLLESSQVFTAIEAEKDIENPNAIEPTQKKQKSSSILESYAVNYNQLAAEGKFNKVICRESHLHELTEILCRKNKNNPILLGEPGIGKTALIEGLAVSIVKSECSEHLLGHNIFGLDLAAMIAGTKYRGQFEERLKNLIDELKEMPKLILFIDEMHTLVGAGAAEGSMDAANILKPMLARGEIRCIGATTFNEYKKNIEKDGALARRFQPVNVEEPSASNCKKILRGIADGYESFHSVRYSQKALDLCVDLSIKYIHDRFLPDKAIDLMDQAGSKVKIANFKRPAKAKKIEAELEHLMQEEDECVSVAAKADLSTRQEILFQEYKKIIKKWSDDNKKKDYTVQPEDVYYILSKKLNIPIDKISETSEKEFLNLEKELNQSVIGQEEAISAISKSLIRNKAGLKSDHKPIGSFLLLGRSGVGKTYTGKVVAQKLFGSQDNFININMSEYSESFTGSKLIGAAPGYVGYESSGQLTEKVRKRPYSVVLFDEIEKAHPNVIQTLLQILDEGTIQDNMGRNINFKNCVIFITGNIGSEIAQGKVGVGFATASQEYTKSEIKQRVKKEALKKLSPEFLNRLDDIIIFNSFDESNFSKIVGLHLSELILKLKDQSIKLSITSTAKKIIAKECQKLEDGARPIAKVIEDQITNPLSEKMLEIGRDAFTCIKVTSSKSGIVFKFS